MVRTRSSNKKQYPYKAKKPSLKALRVKDTEPVWSPQHVSIGFTALSTNRWWNLFQIRYYDNIDPDANTVRWSDNPDRDEVNLVDTVIHITTSTGAAITITIYYTTSKITVQGKSVTEWLAKEYPRLRTVYGRTENIYRDLERECKLVFSTANNDSTDGEFIQWNEKSTSQENYTPPGIPDEIKSFLDEIIEEVIRPLSTNPPPPKKITAPKKTNAGKPTLDETFANNITRTINKLDDRIANTAGELGEQVLHNVMSVINPMLQESEKCKHAVSLLSNQFDALSKEVSTINKITINMKKLILDEVNNLIHPFKRENKILTDNINGLKQEIIELKWELANKREQPPPAPIIPTPRLSKKSLMRGNSQIHPRPQFLPQKTCLQNVLTHRRQMRSIP